MTEDEVIAAAIRILKRRIREEDCLASPQAVRDYLRLAIGDREREVLWSCCWTRSAA
jgi:DNA repair protein RadC